MYAKQTIGNQKNAKTGVKSMKDGMKMDERAVSPVIATILMVAITVILAAVIGAYTLGVDVSENTPTTRLTFKDAAGGSPPVFPSVLMAHDGGDALSIADLKFSYRVTGTDAWTDGQFYDMSNSGTNTGSLVTGDTLQCDGDSVGAMGIGVFDTRIIHVPSGKIIAVASGVSVY